MTGGFQAMQWGVNASQNEAFSWSRLSIFIRRDFYEKMTEKGTGGIPYAYVNVKSPAHPIFPFR